MEGAKRGREGRETKNNKEIQIGKKELNYLHFQEQTDKKK